MENAQQGKENLKNLENLASLAQSLDKLQTQLNQAVLDIDPENSKFTLGVFWRKYKFSIKVISAVVLPVVVTLWSLFNWWGHVEHNFESLMNEINKVHTFNSQHEKKVETFTDSFGKILDKISVKNPSDVYDEVILLRRYLSDSLSELDVIKDEIDKIFMLTLVENYGNKDVSLIIEQEIEKFLKSNGKVKGETSENKILNH